MRKRSKTTKALSIGMKFKPLEPGNKLRSEERRLLVAYIGEILAEIEAEEQKLLKNKP